MEKLTTRQHNLKNWLEDNFESGKWFTIEEVCEAGIGYYLNKDPKSHDKCIALANDVKALNWATNVKRYIPIVKDKKGSIKLAESKQELKDFIQWQKDKVEQANKYANHLQSLIEIDGTMPIVNLANRCLGDKELKVISIYASEETND